MTEDLRLAILRCYDGIGHHYPARWVAYRLYPEPAPCPRHWGNTRAGRAWHAAHRDVLAVAGELHRERLLTTGECPPGGLQPCYALAVAGREYLLTDALTRAATAVAR